MKSQSVQNGQHITGITGKRQMAAETLPELRIGTTGDYRPFTWLRPDGSYEGQDIDLMKEICRKLGFRPVFVATSWPDLTADLLAGRFTAAIGGISPTSERRKHFLCSDVYCHTGKTILCRRAEAARFSSLSAVNRPGVRVMFNPGGTNERFARAHLADAALLCHEDNSGIPALVAAGRADVMVTETVEAAYHVQHDPRLAAPLAAHPFTDEGFVILLAAGQDDLLMRFNAVLLSSGKCQKECTP